MIRNFKHPDFVLDNIQDLHSERVARYMTLDMLSSESGLSIDTLKAYENFMSWPKKNSYNKLARIFGWKLWQD